MSAGLWGVAVVLAVGAGSGAVAAASSGNGRQVLTRDQVDRDLARQPAVAASPSTGQPTVLGEAAQTLAVTGGTLVVQCDQGAATLLRWIPKSGFRADDPVTGPAATVSVRFESDVSEDVTVTASCTGGTASAKVTRGDDHGRRGPDPTSSPTATGGDRGGDGDGDKHKGGGKGGDGRDNDAITTAALATTQDADDHHRGRDGRHHDGRDHDGRDHDGQDHDGPNHDLNDH
ncbi:MAG TPA: hypothetical protein VGJ28_04110 [Micromonosporaceae bacterium]